MEKVSLKTKLLALLRRAREAELEWIDTLSEAEREASGTLERWSAKDLLVHIAFWKERRTELLVLSRRGEVPPPPKRLLVQE